MKKIFLLCTVLMGAANIFAQTLFTYGANAVSKDEFLRAYNKNKTPVEDREKSLREYLDLYTKFKLKVKAARDLKLDTLEQLKYDLQNFRSQIEETYLTDEKAMDALTDEALLRGQKDIRLLHFYVPVNNKQPADDSMKAYKAINEVYEKLKDGETDYDEMVNEISEKIITVKGKDLGYITVLTIPYAMENIVYALKPGEVSKIYRTKSALHVFKNAGERASAGKWKVAQILFALPPDVSGEDLKQIERTADSVYTLLKAGASFAELAKKYSDDKLTLLNGGEMPEFGTAKYDLPFENAVFALKNDGDITEPVFTNYGFHIVKRLQQHPLPADRSDENFIYNLKQQILQNTRFDKVKENFARQILARTGFKRNKMVKEEQLFRFADSVSAAGAVGKYPINKLVIFSFAKSAVKGSDWLNFVKDYKLNTDVYKGEDNNALLSKYIATAALEYYRKHLEEYNADFQYQLQEFKEGNVLFEIMERNVWSKAANDTAGLKQYYDAHKPAYQWAESAGVLLFNCGDEEKANTAINDLKNEKNWRKIMEEREGSIQADSARYEVAQLPIPTGTVLKEGMITTALVNITDNTASFVKVLHLYPAAQQRNFEEARGLVINDYQNHLEEKWLNELKTKYPVKVNEPVFQSLLK